MFHDKVPTKVTEEDHAKRLIEILELDHTCNRCPYPMFNLLPVNITKTECCNMCRTFIGMDIYSESKKGYTYNPVCPCHKFEKSKVFKWSYLALEEKGYI